MTPPEQGGPVNSLPGFLLVVALTVGAIWIGEIPLPITRPPTDKFVPDRHAEIQQYDARLWQDPFEIIKSANDSKADSQHVGTAFATVADVVRTLDQFEKVDTAGSPQQTDLCNMFAREEMQQQQTADIVIAVMLPGEPYAEDVEARRRIRYAVVSGLAQSGYTPYNSRHMGLAGLRLNVEDVPAPIPVHVPFEWFKSKQGDGQRSPVLLLWVNEAPMHRWPLHGLQEVVQKTCGCLAKPEIVVLGPADSDTLHALLREAGQFGEDKRFPFKLRVYSPRATVGDRQLLQDIEPVGKADRKYKDIAEFLELGNLTDRVEFHRTIATDRELAIALVKELGLRGIKPGDGIVLVSEWDTLYGRALPQSFMEEMQPHKDEDHNDVDETGNKEIVCPPWSICRFSYLRGLDGMLPGQDVTRQGVSGDTDKNTGKGAIETAFGNQQIDYLRRIAVRIADLDQEMKQNGQSEGVKAIGVLGSDVYDKLLILRALRPRFPEAIFFTTDLDARLLHPNERAVARNLVVAAGYGLRLNGWLQHDIPDFRDSYQTAYFLSVQLALLESKEARAKVMHKLHDRNAKPRIFEIGRSRPVDLGIRVDNSNACNLVTCESYHPGAHRSKKLVWYGIAPLLLLLLFWYSFNRAAVMAFLNEAGRGIVEPLRRPPGPWYRQIHYLLADKWLWGMLLALLFAGLLGWEFYRIGRNIFMSRLAADGEPFFWFEGVSIWPSVMLRALAGLLALYFLLRGMHLMRKNDNKLTEEFFASHRNAVFGRPRKSLGKRIWLCLVRTRFCRVVLLGWLPRKVAGVQRRYKKAVYLWRDAVQPYTRTALLGRMLLTLLLIMAFLWPLVSLFPFEPPNTPFRGAESSGVNRDILGFAVLSFLLLLVFVIDTTRRTARLVNSLGRCAIWPDNTMQKTGCADASEHYCEEWLNIQFIAARTDVVGRFIYYPFLVLSLIIMSRSTVIDNWQISPRLAMIFAFYLGVLIICTLLLRNAAETARSNMLRSLTRKIIEARGTDVPEHRVKHLELMKGDIQAERRGTFSSYLDQPWIKALLLPIGSYSGLQLLEYLSYLRL